MFKTALSLVSDRDLRFHVSSTQIFFRNPNDLNCKRHFSLFNSKNIISEFCFGCYKVQVEPDNLLDLMMLLLIFYELELEDDVTRKCIVEVRDSISGFYKAFLYCSSYEHAQRIRFSLDEATNKNLGRTMRTFVKRGCSEFAIEFPEYAKIDEDESKIMSYPNEWKPIERQFDKERNVKKLESLSKTIPGLCYSDICIIDKWIDYAKGLGDPSAEIFGDREVQYQAVYKIALARRDKFNNFKSLENGH